jgi:hypothetical protein
MKDADEKFNYFLAKLEILLLFLPPDSLLAIMIVFVVICREVHGDEKIN